MANSVEVRSRQGWSPLLWGGFFLAAAIVVTLCILEISIRRVPSHCSELTAALYVTHLEILKGEQIVVFSGLPTRCDGSLDQEGNVRQPRFKIRSDGTTCQGEKFDFAMYHENGGLHTDSHGNLSFEVTLYNRDGSGSRDSYLVRVPDYDDPEYWDWFERFDKGEATIDDYIGY